LTFALGLRLRLGFWLRCRSTHGESLRAKNRLTTPPLLPGRPILVQAGCSPGLKVQNRLKLMLIVAKAWREVN
jgi:hypothetical protein